MLGSVNDVQDGENYAGAAYVFTRSNGTWSEQGRLTASDASEDDEFGESLDIDGDTLVVGANLNNHSTDAGGLEDVGSAYVFSREDGSWSEQARFIPSDLEDDSYFGTSVAVQGERIAVGAHKAGEGAVYMFGRESGEWTRQQKVTASDADGFGRSVDLRADRLVVGAPWSDAGERDGAGVAYVFTS